MRCAPYTYRRANDVPKNSMEVNCYEVQSGLIHLPILPPPTHSLIRGVLIQSCSAGAKNFTNYVFCHPKFSGVIQNIENRCAIKAKILKFDFYYMKLFILINNRHRQTGSKWHNDFQCFG